MIVFGIGSPAESRDPRSGKGAVEGSILLDVHGLVELLQQRIEVAVPEGTPHFKLWPLLGAARSLRLLDGMLARRQASLSDVVGVLARTHFETWASAMLVCHKGQSAVDALANDFSYWLGKLPMNVSLDDTPEVFRRASMGPPMSTANLARELHAALPLEHPLQGYPLEGYEHLFRGESLFSTHGRIGSYIQHQALAGQGIAVRRHGSGDLAYDRITEAVSLDVILVFDALRALDKEASDLQGIIEELGVPRYLSSTDGERAMD